jgi:hypothetical protein
VKAKRRSGFEIARAAADDLAAPPEDEDTDAVWEGVVDPAVPLANGDDELDSCLGA